MKAKLFVNGVSIEINGSPDEVAEAVEKMTAPKFYPPIIYPYITWSTAPVDTTIGKPTTSVTWIGVNDKVVD